MKDLFKGYYHPDDKEFKKLWQNATLIFDTNVLLNLYRYQQKTRDQLLNILKGHSDRVWIPYHVALEYQRNRVNVISRQHNKYSEVISKTSNFPTQIEEELRKLDIKKRHTHINPDKLVGEIKSVVESFVSDLKKLEESSLQANSEDDIRAKLDKLLSNCIGDNPKNQKWLNDIYKEGEGRYSKCIPPGYKDDDKDGEFYSYAGLVYESKYSDLVVWKQIIEYAKANKNKDVIFVTDDNKDDWWYKVKGRTIGARPELIEEISRIAGVDTFCMYSTEQFLKYSKEHIKAKVDDETIEEARLVSLRDGRVSRVRREASLRVRHAVREWLCERHKDIRFEDRSYSAHRFDYVADEDGRKICYEVKMLHDVMRVRHHMQSIVSLSEMCENMGIDTDDVNLIFVVNSEHEANFITGRVFEFKNRNDHKNIVKVIIGFLYKDLSEKSLRFRSYDIL